MRIEREGDLVDGALPGPEVDEIFLFLQNKKRKIAMNNMVV